MELQINNKTYNFKFGVKFIREVDKIYPLEQDGIKFGMGLQARVMPDILSGNVSTLSKVLVMANKTETPKISLDEIDNYIDDCEDIEQLFDDVTESIGESNAGKLALRDMKQELAEFKAKKEGVEEMI